MKWNGKKKGSSILLVLMVATILIILSATITSALIFTANGNEIQKRADDLLYAAESGIEKLLSNCRQGDYNSLILGQNIPVFDLNYEFTGEGLEVEVKGTVIDYKGTRAIEAESTSRDTRNNATRVVKGIIQEVETMVGGSENLLKYTICSKSTNMYFATMNTDESSVNGFPRAYSEISGNSSGNLSMEEFTLPVLNESSVPRFDATVEVESKAMLKKYGKEDINSTEYRGIVYKEILLGSERLDLYFVNTPSLILETMGDLSNISNTIIISTGAVILIEKEFIKEIDTMTGEPKAGSIQGGFIKFAPRGSLNLSKSSIIGKSVSAYGANHHPSFPTYDKTHSLVSNSPINSKAEIEEVMKVMNKYLSVNWGGGTGGSLEKTYIIADMIY